MASGKTMRIDYSIEQIHAFPSYIFALYDKSRSLELAGCQDPCIPENRTR
jgi:hypothetical protein